MPSGTTWISELKEGNTRSFELTPEVAGLTRSKYEDLKGGDAAHNAAAMRDVLAGKPSAFSDAALMAAGSALVVAGKSAYIKSGVAVARDAVKSGAAAKALERLVEVSNS